MSRLSLLGVLVSVVTLMACGPDTPEMQLIHDTGEALGGADTIAEAETLLIEGEGQQFRLGQNMDPEADLPHWEVDEYRREVDLPGERFRITNERTSMFHTGRPDFGDEHVFGVDGDVAYDVTWDGNVTRGSARVVADRMADHFHHPATLIKLALTEGTTLGNLRQENGEDAIDVTAASGETYTMYVDPTTRYPTRIVSPIYHPMLGDTTLSTTFDDYWETGGLGFGPRLTMPREIEMELDGYPLWNLRVTTAVDRELDDLSAPAQASAAARPEYTPDVQVEVVADGVWRLAGQSHHSVLVEFDDFLVLVEAPQHEARTLAVIAAARELQPEKPLQYVLNTHHHFDHAGGIRAAVAEGLTIITHERNEAFYRDLVARPHSLEPDRLSQNPQALSLELVQGYDVLTLGEGQRTMNIARIPEDLHASANLIACLPREGLLIQADAYSPTADMSPFAPALLAALETLEWDVDEIVPIHGPVVEFAALQEAAEAETVRR